MKKDGGNRSGDEFYIRRHKALRRRLTIAIGGSYAASLPTPGGQNPPRPSPPFTSSLDLLVGERD